MTAPILPGATLGVLGSGQLGRMFAMAARRLGYRVHVFSPDDDTPTGQVADVEYRAAYDDLDQLSQFAKGVSVVTFEFENVPSLATAQVEKYVPVRPAGRVLEVTQHRVREKSFLAEHGIPVSTFRAVNSFHEFAQAVDSIGAPCVLKTASWGYDGKGQRLIRSTGEMSRFWDELGGQACILEGFVDFDREVSVVAARGMDGQFVSYGPIENSHRDHILDVSVVPCRGTDALTKDAIEITRTILEKLDVVGVLCVEFFVTKDDRLLVNELAPRPHNSGHLTIDAHVTSQFEQQVRAVCGLPLGSTELLRPAAMANLLGDLWNKGEPNWRSALESPDAKLHLYGKAEPRAGRKMGHITLLADTAAEARAKVNEVRARL